MARLKHVKTLSLHQGKNIWSADAIPESPSHWLVATGGADGQIFTFEVVTDIKSSNESWRSEDWTTEDVLKACKGFQQDDPRIKRDSFKRYAFVSSFEVLVTTDQGHVFIGLLDESYKNSVQIGMGVDKEEPLVTASSFPIESGSHRASSASSQTEWRYVGFIPEIVSHSILSSSQEDGVAVLSGPHGPVYAYERASDQLTSFHDIPRGLKILNLFCTKSEDTSSSELLPLLHSKHCGV
jgi:hypothetical protein